MTVYTLCSLRSCFGGALDYDGWPALFAAAAMKLATLSLLLALFLHAWIGVRDIRWTT